MVTAQVMAGAAQGGAELFFERLCGALHRADVGVIPAIRRDAGRAARLREAGLSVHQLRFGPLTRFALRPLLRRAETTVAVAWMGRAAAVLPAGEWARVGRLGGYYDLKRFAGCDHLIGNTADIVDWIARQGWPARRVHHLPNFVPDLGAAAPADRRTLGVPDGAPMLLALGRLHPAKGLDTLIQALPGVPRAHAVIAGEGAQRAALTHLAEQLGVADRVHLPGWRGDIGSLLGACDVFVSAARHEPLGNAVLEAWSAGRPVIACAAQGPAALIRDGVDGRLVRVDDAAALRQAIQDVLASGDHAAALAGAGRARYLAGFTEAAVVAEWRGFLHWVAR